MPKIALYTAAVIFALVSLLHWVRYFLVTDLTIGSTMFPVFGSLILSGRAPIPRLKTVRRKHLSFVGVTLVINRTR